MPPFGENDAGTQQAHAGIIALGSTGNTFPLGAELMGKLVVRRLFFGHDHLTEIAVIAYRRTGNQYRWRVWLLRMSSTSFSVMFQRLLHNSCFCSSVQRLSAMGSPAS